MLRKSYLIALVLGLSACDQVTEQTGLELPGSNPVPAIDAPLLQTETLARAPKAPFGVGRPQPPKALALSGGVGVTTGPLSFGGGAIDQASRTIPDKRIRAYLHGIAEKLMASAPEDSRPIQVHVLASPSYEAFAFASGDVYLSINLLADAVSEDEVAVTLAHEIGHVLLDHHAKDEGFDKQREATSTAATIGITGFLTADKVANELGGSLGVDTNERVMAIAGAKLAIDFIANDVINSQWNRRQEASADFFGFDLAVKAGYDPNAMYDSFGHLIKSHEKKKLRLDTIDQKIEILGSEMEAEIESMVTSASFSLGDIASRVFAFGGRVLAAAGSAAIADARDYVRRGYHDPATRMDWSEQYIGKFYPELEENEENPYEDVKRRLGITKLNNAYVEVSDALTQISAKDHAGALKTIRSAYRTAPISRHSFPRLVEASALVGLDRKMDALAALNKIKAPSILSVSGYALKASIAAELGRSRDAMRTLGAGSERYGRDKLQPTRIQVLVKLGKRDEALEEYNRCQSFPETTKNACRKVAEIEGLIEPKKGFADLVGSVDSGLSLDNILGNISPDAILKSE